jgi:hypothetical protein
LRYAIAPSLIAAAISCILSFPAGARFTLAARMIENTTPANPTNVQINGKLLITALSSNLGFWFEVEFLSL